jgi:hypothetical protein
MATSIPRNLNTRRLRFGTTGFCSFIILPLIAPAPCEPQPLYFRTPSRRLTQAVAFEFPGINRDEDDHRHFMA